MQQFSFNACQSMISTMLGKSGSRFRFAAAAVYLFAQAGIAQAQTNYTIDSNSPSFDKWLYPFAVGAGANRPDAPVFGAIGSDGFDDRDGQYFAAFETEGLVPTGRGASNYQILSATFTISIAAGDVLVFDGTYDPVDTYGPNGEAVNNDDPGRPIELFGAAFRNGLTSATVDEDTPYSTGGGAQRSIYPTDFLAGVSINGTNRDVSNNVAQDFDPIPFAIGQIAPEHLNTNGTAELYADVVFTLNLNNPDVLRYLQLSLNEGLISLVTTSLHQASQPGDPSLPSTYPLIGTMEHLLVPTGRLEISVQVVPEPSALTLLLCGFGVFVACWRGKRALQNQEEVL